MNGNWQVGEIARIYVFYFDSREAVEITFHADGSPRRFRRGEFADAPSNFTALLRRPGKEAQRTNAQQQKLMVDALKTVHPTLVLYSTVWNRDGSVAERVDEPTDVSETLSISGTPAQPFKMSEWIKEAEEAAAEKSE